MEEAFYAAKTAYELYQAGESLHHTATQIAEHPVFQTQQAGRLGLEHRFGQGLLEPMRAAGPLSGPAKRRKKGGRYGGGRQGYSGYNVTGLGARPGYTRAVGYYGKGRGEQRMTEKKFRDTALSFTIPTVGAVPATGQLNIIVQGAGEQERVGRKILIHSIHVRCTLVFNPTTGNDPAITFLYLVQDTQCNGAAAGVADVVTGTLLQSAHINLSNSTRFRIIKRFVHRHQATAGTDGQYLGTIQDIEYYKKCSIPLQYDGATGALTETQSNNLFLLAGCDANNNGKVTVTGTVRLRFSD